MANLDGFVPLLHKDDALFREAINFTASETGFLPRLIEKDYFCTVLLRYVASNEDTLVFKGGTCLAKVHARFYRLSEDMDFVISTPFTATRAERSKCVGRLKGVVARIADQPFDFRLVEPLTGANDSTQYNATIGYSSLLNRQKETLKIEVGLREPLLTSTSFSTARTILLSPLSGKPAVPDIRVCAISYIEAMSEKFRAALSRREVAIRDFYDIDYAVNRSGFDPFDSKLMSLIRQKLVVPGNDPVDVSTGRMNTLRLQLDSQLKPVLRVQDFTAFDLERAFEIVKNVATVLK